MWNCRRLSHVSWKQQVIAKSTCNYSTTLYIPTWLLIQNKRNVISQLSTVFQNRSKTSFHVRFRYLLAQRTMLHLLFQTMGLQTNYIFRRPGIIRSKHPSLTTLIHIKSSKQIFALIDPSRFFAKTVKCLGRFLLMFIVTILLKRRLIFFPYSHTCRTMNVSSLHPVWKENQCLCDAFSAAGMLLLLQFLLHKLRDQFLHQNYLILKHTWNPM